MLRAFDRDGLIIGDLFAHREMPAALEVRPVEGEELVEHFQWLTEEQSRNLPTEKREEVALEMADILIYLIRTAERLDIDLLAAAERKIAINESRYPADKVYGDARRASEYD